jgi:hypothetical protein
VGGLHCHAAMLLPEIKAYPSHVQLVSFFTLWLAPSKLVKGAHTSSALQIFRSPGRVKAAMFQLPTSIPASIPTSSIPTSSIPTPCLVLQDLPLFDSLTASECKALEKRAKWRLFSPDTNVGELGEYVTSVAVISMGTCLMTFPPVRGANQQSQHTVIASVGEWMTLCEEMM